MRTSLMRLGVAFAVAIVSGCTEGPGTIFNSFTLDTGGEPGPSITTGARQRLISNMTTGVASGPGRVHARRIICVEPSPDVAAAVANSFGIGVSILGQGSGSLSGAQVEGVAQIAERTVAIQALLKQGYQACLDYANGAITGTTYSLRTSRLDDLLVTLILAENASGAFGRSGAALGTKASGEAKASLTDLSRAAGNVAKLQTDLATAEDEVKNKENELKTAQAATEQAAADKKETAEAKVTAKKAEFRAAEAKRDAILQQLKSSTETLSKAAGEVTTATGVGSLMTRPSAEIAGVMGEMQARFLDKDVDQSYISACLTELGHRKVPTASDKEFQQLMLKRVKDTVEAKQPLETLMMEDFYLGSQLGDENRLTRHCENTLEKFVEASIQNRHELKVKKLEIERAKIALLTRQAEIAAEAKVIHPSASLNLLAEAIKVAAEKLGELKKAAIPAPKDPNFTQAMHAATTAAKDGKVKELDGLINQATAATTGASKGEIDSLEALYLSLVSDIRKSGMSTQRKLWKADYDKQQAIAEVKNKSLTELSKKLKIVSEETDELIRRIKSIKI